MMERIAGAPSVSNTAPEANGRDAAKIQDAARQFESLLLASMLKSMRENEGGWMGTGEDEASSSAMEYAQEMFAQSLASSGGLGLTNMVVKGLEASESQ